MERIKLKKIINHYGFDHQFQKLKEEMTELAFCTSEKNMKEEIADVLVVLGQILLYKNWTDEVLEIKNYKINRQLKRIEIIKDINSGEKCDEKCNLHNLLTHNACLCCKALKDSPYHKDYIKGKTDEEIAIEVAAVMEENFGEE